MPVKRPKPPTPEFVIHNGWRDRPYVGKDRCQECWGTGTRTTLVGENCTVMHRTCPDCGGKGHT